MLAALRNSASCRQLPRASNERASRTHRQSGGTHLSGCRRRSARASGARRWRGRGRRATSAARRRSGPAFRATPGRPSAPASQATPGRRRRRQSVRAFQATPGCRRRRQSAQASRARRAGHWSAWTWRARPAARPWRPTGRRSLGRRGLPSAAKVTAAGPSVRLLGGPRRAANGLRGRFRGRGARITAWRAAGRCGVGWCPWAGQLQAALRT